MKKQKSRKPLRHKALLVHLFCQHMTRKDSEEIERFSAIFLFWMMQWALIQHDRADGFHQLDHFAAQYIGNAFAIYGGRDNWSHYSGTERS